MLSLPRWQYPCCSWCTNHVITQCAYLFNYRVFSFSKSYLKFATSDTYWHICHTHFGLPRLRGWFFGGQVYKERCAIYWGAKYWASTGTFGKQEDFALKDHKTTVAGYLRCPDAPKPQPHRLQHIFNRFCWPTYSLCIIFALRCDWTLRSKIVTRSHNLVKEPSQTWRGVE